MHGALTRLTHAMRMDRRAVKTRRPRWCPIVERRSDLLGTNRLVDVQRIQRLCGVITTTHTTSCRGLGKRLSDASLVRRPWLVYAIRPNLYPAPVKEAQARCQFRRAGSPPHRTGQP